MATILERSLTLQQLLERSEPFVLGAELVTTRGTLHQPETRRIARLAMFLAEFDPVHFVSITDNPGGSARISPENLGVDLAYRGKNVVIHLSCKDLNRNGIESRAWQLASEGLHNVLALSGDYPVEGYRGKARGVFDIDSIGLLQMLREMNEGLAVRARAGAERLARTSFHLGAAVTNTKRLENEVMPQYFKLEKKVRTGAQFLITQMGYDSRKLHELLAYMQWRGISVPTIANVYVLGLGAARAFAANRIPGCVVTPALLEVVERQAASPDRGKRFFLELAGKQVAIAQGLGYRGAYLGGIHEPAEFEAVVEIARRFAQEDWRAFAREISFSQPGEFYFFEADPESGLIHPDRVNPSYLASLAPERREGLRSSVALGYRVNRAVHDLVFQPGTRAFAAAERLYRIADRSPALTSVLHRGEHAAKRALFDCRDCGDCSLPDIAYLCPESQCAKNQRNGPCGGTHQGTCEVYDLPCIWSRAYDRLKPYGEEAAFVERPPVLKDGALEKKSAWQNFFLGRDHHGRRPPQG
jgi:methylenetetrahydrofolate reductase (NADPH)